jgi:hypothetical protein
MVVLKDKEHGSRVQFGSTYCVRMVGREGRNSCSCLVCVRWTTSRQRDDKIEDRCATEGSTYSRRMQRRGNVVDPRGLSGAKGCPSRIFCMDGEPRCAWDVSEHSGFYIFFLPASGTMDYGYEIKIVYISLTAHTTPGSPIIGQCP